MVREMSSSEIPLQRRLLFIITRAVFWLIVFDVPVHVHDAWGLLEQIADLPRQLYPLDHRWPINFGHQRLQHRRSGRNFGYLDPRAKAFGDGLPGAGAPAWRSRGFASLRSPFGNRFTWMSATLAPRRMIVVTHQAIEVEGRCHTCVGLDVRPLPVASALPRAAAREPPGPSVPSACLRACRQSPGTRSCYRRAAS